MNITEAEHSALNTDTDTEISGFKIELTFDDDNGDIVSSCFVEKGDYCSSLALLMGEGFIESDNGDRVLHINDRIRTRIEDWAIDHGY